MSARTRYVPGLVEQLGLGGPQDGLDEKLIGLAEQLLGYVISSEHRQMIINNVGKASAAGRTLKFVLRLRTGKLPGPELDPEIADFVKQLAPAQKTPSRLAVKLINFFCANRDGFAERFREAVRQPSSSSVTSGPSVGCRRSSAGRA